MNSIDSTSASSAVKSLDATEELFQTGVLGNTTPLSNETFNQTQTGPVGVALITFSTLLMAFGIVGNTHCLIIYIQRLREKKQPLYMKKPYPVFVISLAIVDLFACFILLPFDIVNMSGDFTPLSEELCKLLRFLQITVHATSIIQICIISIYSCRLVVFPHSRKLTAKLAIRFCISANVNAVLAAVPVIWLSGHLTVTTQGQRGKMCAISDKYLNTAFPIVYLSLGFAFFVITSIIVSISNVWIAYHVCQRKKASNEKDDEAKDAKIRKSTLTLIIIVLIYFTTYICFLITIGAYFGTGSGSWTVLRILTAFPLINHVINPIVYGWRDEKFRGKVEEFWTSTLPSRVASCF